MPKAKVAQITVAQAMAARCGMAASSAAHSVGNLSCCHEVFCWHATYQHSAGYCLYVAASCCSLAQVYRMASLPSYLGWTWGLSDSSLAAERSTSVLARPRCSLHIAFGLSAAPRVALRLGVNGPQRSLACAVGVAARADRGRVSACCWGRVERGLATRRSVRAGGRFRRQSGRQEPAKPRGARSVVYWGRPERPGWRPIASSRNVVVRCWCGPGP
jgi:hypothetical protein